MTVRDHDEAEFDDLLEQALSEYRDAEPLAGMEARLLRRLQTRHENRTNRWLRWSLAAAGVVAVIVAIWITTRQRVPQTAGPEARVVARPIEPQPHQPEAHMEPPLQPAVGAQDPAVAPHHAAAIEVTRAPVKQAVPDVFPVPIPLTPEERAFVAALERHPDAVSSTADVDSPAAIAQIEIKPLSIANYVPGENQ